MHLILEEYRTLVMETRLFLQGLTPPKESAPLPIPRKKQEPIEKDPAPVPLTSPVKEKIIEESIAPLKKPITTQTIGPFLLEKNTPLIPLDLSQIRKTMRELVPSETLCLAFVPEELPFLQKIAEALTSRGLTCKAITIEKSSLPQLLLTTQLKTYLVPFDVDIAQMLSLSKEVAYHKPIPFASSNRLLFLHPSSLYESDIEYKRHLWNSLKTLLPQ